MWILRSISICLLVGLTATAQSQPSDKTRDRDWKDAQIKDALRAAPSTVTDDAPIYAWNATNLVLVRAGNGPYTCVASGSWSLRLGKPALPYPDPFCADRNAWAYMAAMWKERDPLHPSKPLPRAPGLVWMLAGMDVVNGRVFYGPNAVQAGTAVGTTITMTPHIMILPLDLDAAKAGLSVTYDPDHAQAMWVMGAGTPTAHLHIHFSPAAHEALKQVRTAP